MLNAFPTHRIPFAIGPDGKPASIDDVPRGLQCECICPACKAQLVAKKGERRLKVWHFAHASGTSCAGALESSIHLAVKEIIEQEKRLLVPPCHVFRYPEKHINHINWSKDGEYDFPPYRYTNHPRKFLEAIQRIGGGSAAAPSKPMLIEFDEVAVEQQEGNIRPDLIGIVGEKRLYIEVAVTHPIDGEKLRRIRARNISALQILVPYGSQGLSWEQLRQVVLEKTDGKAWAYSRLAESQADSEYEKNEPFRQMLKDKADKEKAEQSKKEKEAAERQARQQAAEAEQAFRNEVEREKQEAEAERLRIENRAKRDAEWAKLSKELEESLRLEAIQLAEKEAVARAQKAAEDARRAREREEAITLIQTGSPSPDLPIKGPVIFFDIDSALSPDSNKKSQQLGLLSEALGDHTCCIILTSESRYSKTANELASMLSKIGGRHVSTTPILDSNNPYGTRQREIDAWLANHENVHWIIFDGGQRGFKHNNHVLSRHGFSEDDAKVMREWLQSIRQRW